MSVQRLFILAMAIVSSSASAEWISEQAEIMGTRVSVTLWHTDQTRGQAAVDKVMTEMRRIDNAYSPYRPDSDLSQMNSMAGQSGAPALSISPEMTQLLDKSLFYGELTNGAFDITFASLARHYDYRDKKTPTEAQRQALLPAIDFRHITLDREQQTVRYQHPAVYVDLGGIAKGYAVDRAVSLLQQQGISQASVSAGGDSRVLGNRRGRPWMVGIKQPRGDAGIAITLPLSDTAISTSGDYERFFINDSGERVHHIVNPQTGKSTDTLASVTILGPSAFDTDALSTSVFVLGQERGLALIESLPNFDAIIIDRAGQVHYSSGLMPPQ
ncbi:FAD:protein FMN transferase [Gilvimarinus sp. SDUM040013]|uniref:FAD:protein FMN transferase n=1 Tax=Gilvimarinus gilvus TaxID=3058038 RepID=A0ABU4S161_9GAMM|nr:FAD:protein FMN transferase [Gilvimarinus sp. SDUM040013]MDO3384616.1 FAD:protein FMN transferase [Gilvimarinus sp. SDUM040013]MDX6850202.1 FAD:protein FMN transferase [Gilvimarinus sp. SDUM040013]